MATDHQPGQSRRFVLVALLAGLLEMAALAAWQRNGYWNFSDGAYAESARELLAGMRLYVDQAAAQPPPVYLLGGLVLAAHDSLWSLRAALAGFDLAGAGLVAACVWRLTGRRWAALGAGLSAPLVPISLHEHALLTPETLAGPLLMASALLCAHRDRGAAGAGGALGALAAAAKFAFGLPAFLIVLAAAARRRALAGLLLGAGLLAGAGGLIFGGALWRGAVTAQLDVGRPTLRYAGGLVAQGLWNELGLIVAAGAGMALGRRARDPALLRTVAAAGVGGLLLLASVLKRGSYVNVLAAADPPLVALAACGAVWAWERARRRAVVLAAVLLVAAQSASILARPGDPLLARRPLAHSGLERALSPAAVDRAVAAARRCPERLAYSGDPYIAFLARRRMPGGQADLFIVRYARPDAAFARRARADQPRCPT